jgi:hypothetical protein
MKLKPLERHGSLQEYPIEGAHRRATHSEGDEDKDDDFNTPRSFGIPFTPGKDDDMYDLRIGESMFNNSADGNTLEDQLNTNHALRAELEDYRQQLIQSDQILDFYKKVLDGEIKKKNELKGQLNHLKLIQEYGYDDDDRSIGELKMKIEDLKILLEEKNLALQAQRDINKKLVAQLHMTENDEAI